MAVEIDIRPRPENAYRIVVWNVGPAIERKYPRLEALDANVVIAPRAGSEVRLYKAKRTAHTSMAWIGRHALRGLGVLGFSGTFVKLDGGKWDQRLEWIAPVQVVGPVTHQLLAIWALNARAQVKFKSNPPAAQTFQMMHLYRKFLSGPTVVAGDFDNNPVFHRNDPNWDMLELVALLEAAGLTSAYHAFHELDHGDPREQPTRWKSDPIVGVAAHHVDYCFLPTPWLDALLDVQLGDRETWIKTGKPEEHVPLVVDLDARLAREITLEMKRKSGSY